MNTDLFHCLAIALAVFLAAGCGAVDGAPTPALRHHTIDYLELGVTDLPAARRFYGAAFGWQFNDYGPDYAGIRRRGEAASEVGGIRQLASGAVAPLLILYSLDLEASLAAVEAAGGRVVKQPFAFPGGRRFHFTDPAGNELAVWSDR